MFFKRMPTLQTINILYRQSPRLLASSTSPPLFLSSISPTLRPPDRSCSTSNKGEPLYPGHIDTTTFQKILLAGGSALTALSNPWRADMVAVNGEVTGEPALRYMLERFKETSEGQKILRDKPRINKETLTNLSNHAPDTLGGVYFAFMNKYNLNPDARDKVQYVDNVELAYVMTRYRETHDLTHAVLDMPTNMLGEVLVKWVEAAQTRLPMCIGGAVFGPLRFRTKQRNKYMEVLPWAVSVGTGARFLPGIYYEQRWDQNIDDFRAEMKIPPIPKL